MMKREDWIILVMALLIMFMIVVIAFMQRDHEYLLGMT